MDKRGKLNTDWKKRFFVLKSNVLSYYPNHKTSHVKGKIDLRRVVVRPAEIQATGAWEFHLVTEDRIYSFKVRTQREMVDWMNHIQLQASLIISENLQFDEIQESIDMAEYTKVSCRDKLKSASSSIYSFLEFEGALEFYLDYLKTSHCEENLLFYQAVKEYKTVESDQRGKAHDIFNTFVKDGAPYEIGIEANYRKELAGLIKKPDPRRVVFDDILSKIMSLMENTTFKDFMKSSFFIKAMLSIVSL